jgi:transcriptional regulator with XRE-family HTH domain
MNATGCPSERRLHTTMLRVARLLAGHPQWELARIAGVAQRTISRWERGESVPPLDVARRLAAELRVPVALLDATVELVLLDDEALERRSGAVVAVVRIRPNAGASDSEAHE